jgi:hypothetical protein
MNPSDPVIVSNNLSIVAFGVVMGTFSSRMVNKSTMIDCINPSINFIAAVSDSGASIFSDTKEFYQAIKYMDFRAQQPQPMQPQPMQDQMSQPSETELIAQCLRTKVGVRNGSDTYAYVDDDTIMVKKNGSMKKATKRSITAAMKLVEGGGKKKKTKSLAAAAAASIQNGPDEGDDESSDGEESAIPQPIKPRAAVKKSKKTDLTQQATIDAEQYYRTLERIEYLSKKNQELEESLVKTKKKKDSLKSMLYEDVVYEDFVPPQGSGQPQQGQPMQGQPMQGSAQPMQHQGSAQPMQSPYGNIFQRY